MNLPIFLTAIEIFQMKSCCSNGELLIEIQFERQ